MSGCRYFSTTPDLLMAYMDTTAWVAARLRTLAALDPHEWDRSTLVELAEALTSSPKLKEEGKRS